MAKVYKITSSETDKIYIGSTCGELSYRLYYHRANIESTITSKEILKYKDAKIELIEECLKENKRTIEQHWIDYYGDLCVNKIRAEVKPQVIRSAEYRQNNPEKLKESFKKWYNSNKTKVSCPSCGNEMNKTSLRAHTRHFHPI